MATHADASSDETRTTVLTNVLPSLEEYNFDGKVIGRCLIINNHNFDPVRTGQIERTGTDVDAREIERIFSTMGFEVLMHKDLTCMQMRFAMSDMAEENHTDYGCFVCFILSHGCENEIIYGVDGQLKLHDLIEKVKGLKCPTLIGKPKLFFVQACRGSYYDHGVDLTDGQLAGQGLDGVKTISAEADIMIAYSVVPGHFSWRNSIDGSWFIQSLCHVLDGSLTQTTDLLGIMTVVCKLVSEKFESVTDNKSTSGLKQVPWIVSTLTKLVYFRKKMVKRVS